MVQSASVNRYGGDAGQYADDDVSYDLAIRRHDLPVTVSAGNIYPDTFPGKPTGGETTLVMKPAAAKNVISVGAMESIRAGVTCADPNTTLMPSVWERATSHYAIAYMSRRGTQDGRIKPDVVAPGTLVSAAWWQTGRAWCSTITSPDTWTNYLISSGTSFSAPQAAAAIAILNKKKGWSGSSAMGAAMAKAALIGNTITLKNGFDDYTDTLIRPRPDAITGQGWGRLNLHYSLYSGEHEEFLDGKKIATGFLQPLTKPGELRDAAFRVVDTSKPAVIVLAWSDEAGL